MIRSSLQIMNIAQDQCWALIPSPSTLMTSFLFNCPKINFLKQCKSGWIKFRITADKFWLWRFKNYILWTNPYKWKSKKSMTFKQQKVRWSLLNWRFLRKTLKDTKNNSMDCMSKMPCKNSTFSNSMNSAWFMRVGYSLWEICIDK